MTCRGLGLIKNIVKLLYYLRGFAEGFVYPVDYQSYFEFVKGFDVQNSRLSYIVTNVPYKSIASKCPLLFQCHDLILKQVRIQ